MTDNQASRGELSSMNNLASGALIEGSQSLLRKDSGEDLVYEITYTVPSANITRLFSVKPTSMVLKELSLDDDYPEYGLTFAVDTSIPVIVSVFIHAKESINIAHDITLE